MSILDKLFRRKQVKHQNNQYKSGPIRICTSDVVAVSIVIGSPDFEIGQNEVKFFWDTYNAVNPGLMSRAGSVRWHITRTNKELSTGGELGDVLFEFILNSDFLKGLGDVSVFDQIGDLSSLSKSSVSIRVPSCIMTFVKPMPGYKKINILAGFHGSIVFYDD